MKLLKRWKYSLLKKMPGGREIVRQKKMEDQVFENCILSCFDEVGKSPEALYYSAYERAFLLLMGFYKNGFRGDILEFGVLYGFSSRILANLLKEFHFDESRLFLFDSFAGLPELTDQDKKSYEHSRSIWQQGFMDVPDGLEQILAKKLSSILSKERVLVCKGFFEETLEKTIQEHTLKQAMLVHLDCDLYSSTKFVLDTLLNHQIIQDGTLLLFDDWMTSFGNPNMNQRKALNDVMQERSEWQFEPYFNYGLGCQVFIVHHAAVSEPSVSLGQS